MASVDHVECTRAAPEDVADRLLWRDAQQMIGRHARPDDYNECVWCGQQWPCPPRKLAERADVAARRPWREAWTARHDFRSIPGWRADLGERSGYGADQGRYF